MKIIGIIILLAIVVVFAINYPKLKLISGFTAKNMASSYFLAKRDVDYTHKMDNYGPLTKMATTYIDENSKTAISNVFGLSTKKAIYRVGVGAVIVNDKTDQLDNYKTPNRNFTKINLPYPYGDLEPEKHVFNNVNYGVLNDLVDNFFLENNLEGIKNTRSVLVLYKGKIIVEKYAPDFNKNSLLQGWSITKSLLTTCFGILEKDNQFDIHAPIKVFPEWLKDDRKNITTNHLLRMESGLEWEENYSTICDVTKMLFEDSDVTTRPIAKKAIVKPETIFNYASGSSNILSALLRKQFKSHQAYLNFPYTSFIDKIGMHSMMVETDVKGNYVASSYSWATTRDWAKFGQLMLDKGVWNGTQIFKPNWIKYITSPNKTSKGEYGGQWWLNDGNYMPNVPKDCYYADGYQGQRIFVIPSKDLVVVRFGITQLKRVDFYPLFDQLIGGICRAVN